MNINFKKAWTTVCSNIKVTLFSRYDDNSYLNGLSKAVRTVNPNESDSADKLYKAIKRSGPDPGKKVSNVAFELMTELS